ncbi:MAG: hypothetical protein V4695_12815 [Pseudomonadota bacterium]
MDYRFLSDRFHEMRAQQINQHGRAVNSTDKQVSEIVLQASLKAIQHVQAGTRATRMQAVPLGTGLGKSSSAYALIAAFAMGDMSFSAAYVVPTIKMAEEAQAGIEALTGEGCTALWSSLHKHKGVDRKKAFDELGHVPTRVVDKRTLGAQRIVIVTHKQLEQELESGKAEGVLHYLSQPRSIVFIDEHPDLLQQAQVTTGDVEGLHASLARHAPGHPWLPVLAQAGYYMACLTQSSSGQRYTPAVLVAPEAACTFDDETGVSLWDMTDPEASEGMRLGEQAKLRQVVDFLRAAAQGRAFYSRKEHRFFAYTLHLGTDYPGFVLLDATSELAGLVTLHPDVSMVPVVHVNYERLEVLRMDMPDKFRKVREALKVAADRAEYGLYIRESVLANTQAGDDVLVVVHKDVLTDGAIISASGNPENPTDWEGRKVNTQHWGAGVGSNQFRKKTHVFMFGSFYQPGSATIAQAHGWSGKALSIERLALAESVPIAGGLYSPRGDYRQVQEGNVLKWIKQLAMRGNARNVNGEGKCGAMKLFLTLELGMLLPNMQRLFPGAAPAPLPAALPAYLAAAPQQAKQGRQALVDMVMHSKLSCISAESIEANTGIRRDLLSRECKALPSLHLLGWSLKAAGDIGKAGRMKYLVNDARFMQEVLLAA